MKKVPAEKSLPSSTKSSNWYYSSTFKSTDVKNINYKLNREAIERYKKLCVKTFTDPQHSFITILKGENLSLYLDNYNIRDIQNINKIIGSYFYFRQIILAPSDGRSIYFYNHNFILACTCPINSNHNHMKKPKTACKVLSHNEKILEEKERREKERENEAKIYTIIQGIAKNICLSEAVKVLNINEFHMTTELCEFLSEGLIINKSLRSLFINNSEFTNESFEILGKGLLGDTMIECLDLSDNALDDKCGNMLSRIIIRQTQRRDQVIWMYGLRNEKPLNNDYTRGLIYVNLSNNQLGDSAADEISNALSFDSYIRSIDLKNNQISEEGCKMFIKVLRRNLTILNLDLRGNYGYLIENNLHKRLVIKLAKNIKNLHQQYIYGTFDKNEYNFLKKYVNYEYFNVEVPQHIVQMYSASNCNSNADMNSNPEGETEENCNQIETKINQNDDLEGEGNQSQGDEFNKEDGCENIYEDSEFFNRINTDSNLNPLTVKDKQKYNIHLSKLEEQNQNLIHENLHLRKNILAMRAIFLKNRANEGSSKYNQEALENNEFYSKLINQSLNQNLSSKASNNDKRVSAKTRDVKESDDNYFIRIENLFSELTMLMDNMETNIKTKER